jgi:hypothetical protein
MPPMNAIQLVISANLAKDALLRTVFEAVAKGRSIQIRDLRAKFSSEALEHSIPALKSADLIRESPAPIEDFSTLYVTANGLTAELALKDRNLMDNLAAQI